MIRYKIKHIFKGREVEGPKKGALTIFIPKEAYNRKLFLELAKQHNITRLYFGAGNDRGIHPDMINLLLSIPDHFSVLLEIKYAKDLDILPLKFLKRTKIIYVAKAGFKCLPSVFKIETSEKVHWFDLTELTTNDLNDDLYSKDECI